MVNENKEKTMTEKKTVAGDLLWDEEIIPPEPDMGADDFGFFLKETKGAMFTLGCKMEGDTRGHHAPRFDVDDDCMTIGSAIFTETTLRTLDKSDQ
jgi:amidohydrolase